MTVFTKILGLALVGIFLGISLPADAKLAANKLAANELAANKLAANKLEANKLAANKLAANKLADKRAANAMSVGNGAFNDVVAVKLAAGTRLAR